MFYAAPSTVAGSFVIRTATICLPLEALPFRAGDLSHVGEGFDCLLPRKDLVGNEATSKTVLLVCCVASFVSNG